MRVFGANMETGRSSNPDGIVAFSPGLRGTSYPGKTTAANPNPNGVAASLSLRPAPFFILSKPGVSGATGRFNGKILTNRAGQMPFDFLMAGDRLPPSSSGVGPNGMTSSLAQKLASMLSQMAEQLAPLHTAINTSSASGAALRIFSRSNSISSRAACARSARHSSRVSPWPLAPGTSRQVAQNPPSSGSPGRRIAVSCRMEKTWTREVGESSSAGTAGAAGFEPFRLKKRGLVSSKTGTCPKPIRKVMSKPIINYRHHPRDRFTVFGEQNRFVVPASARHQVGQATSGLDDAQGDLRHGKKLDGSRSRVNLGTEKVQRLPSGTTTIF
jgi:hypothetical protein